jgi:hypothetical protein
MSFESKEWVLIDDDSLVHMFWSMACKNKGAKLSCFFSFEEFCKSPTFSTLPKESPIYVDLNIESRHDGLGVVKKLGEVHGFNNIYLATGEDIPELQNSFPFLKGVCGKDPPV